MCPNCGSCFSKKSNLYNHLQRGKGCSKREINESDEGVLNLERKEEIKVENGNKPAVLQYAEQNEKNYDESDDELKKTLKCNICEKLFGRSSHLAEHIKSVHEGNKRIYQKAVCGDCGRVFARKCSLNQHITAAHGGNGMNLTL